MKHLLRKYFHVTSLRRKMILSFSLLIISALAALQAANTYQTYIILEQNLTDSVHESLRLGLSNIDYFFEDINNLASGILPEAEVQTALSEKVDYSSLETKSTLRALERTIKKYSATRPYVPKVYLVNLDNQILDNSLQGMAAPEINCDPQTSSLCLSDVHYAPYISQHTPVISFEKNIYSLYTGNQKLGRLIVDMDTRVINQVLYDFSLPMSGETFLINNKKTVLCRSGKYPLSNEAFVNALNFSISKKDGSIKINNEKFLCLTETSPLTGWTLCALIPYNLFARSIVIQMNLTLILFVICILAAIIISRPIINSMYKPIGMLITSMKEVEKGNLNSFVSYHNQDELLSLVEGYNSMLTQIRNLIEQVKNKERSKRQAELYALQAQINPHFLYNTLEIIRGIADGPSGDIIRNCCNALSRMFRYNLKGSNTVTLEQELEQSKYYIYIMQLRFDYLFQVEYRIDETLLQYKIIKFSLQPFIENAIIHGFTDFQQEGTLSISILRNNDSRIQIQISDDGHGMSFDTLDGLKEAFSSIQNSPSRRLENDGIGIANTHQRLLQYFGRDYEIRMESSLETGTVVTLLLPRVLV